eukprot:gene13661-19549_t
MTPGKTPSSLTVTELKSELKTAGLSVSGLKAELVARLQEYMDSQSASAQPEAAADADATPEEEAPAAETAAEEASPEAAADAADGDAAMETEPAAAEEAEQADGAEAEKIEEKPATPEPIPEKDYGLEEWMKMDIPAEWMPRPILRVKNIPEASTLEEVKAAIEEAAGVTLESIVMDDAHKKEGQTQTAIIRMPAPALPWAVTPEDLETPLMEIFVPKPKVVAKSAPKEEAKPETPVKEEAKPDEEAATEEAKPAEEAATEEAKPEEETAMEEAKPAEEAAPEEAEEKKEEVAEEKKEEEAEVKKEEEAEVKKEEAKKETPKPAPKLEDDGRKEGDVFKMALFYINRFNERKIEVGGKTLTFDAANLNCTLFLGNVPDNTDAAQLTEDMATYGALECCFIICNPEGVTKGYGFVEFAVPASADKTFGDERLLTAVFNEYGPVTSAVIAKANGYFKGFAFVEFNALKGLDGTEQPRLGGARLMISFQNPAKLAFRTGMIGQYGGNSRGGGRFGNYNQPTRPTTCLPWTPTPNTTSRKDHRLNWPSLGHSILPAPASSSSVDAGSCFRQASQSNLVEEGSVQGSTRQREQDKLLASLGGEARGGGGRGGNYGGYNGGQQARMTAGYGGSGGGSYGSPQGGRGAYGRGVMGPGYGGRGGGGYPASGGGGARGYGGNTAGGYAGRGGYGGGGGGYGGGGYGGGGGYAASGGGGYGGRGAGGGGATGGYGGGYARGGYGGAAAGGYGASGGYGAAQQGYGATQSYGAAQQGYGQQRAATGYGGYGAAGGYSAAAQAPATGYGATGYGGYGAASGYSAPAATGYGAAATGYGAASGQKRPEADYSAYSGNTAHGYGSAAQDYNKKPRY